MPNSSLNNTINIHEIHIHFLIQLTALFKNTLTKFILILSHSSCLLTDQFGGEEENIIPTIMVKENVK